MTRFGEPIKPTRGNSWQRDLTTGTGWPVALTFNGGNQITTAGYRYDAAGNLVMDNAHCYTYDGENRLSSVAPAGSGACGATTMSYVYDPDGKRVARMSGSAVVEQDYYDAAGHEIAVTNGTGSLQRAEIYAGARHLATWSGNATYFNHADWLGTERARSNSSGTVCETITSLPFGDGQQTPILSCGDPSPDHFTGKERDTESGNDYFGARYYPSSIGRFLSPDWSAKAEPVPYAKLDNPQSLNLYAYMMNNPLGGVDPDGHGCGGANAAICKAILDAISQGVEAGEAMANEAVQQQNQNQNQTQQNQQTQQFKLDKDKVVRYMDRNTHDTDVYHGVCAGVCHGGLAAGGLPWDKDRPSPANKNGPWLMEHGAEVVGHSDNTDLPKKYTPEKADVAVFEGGGPKHNEYGHMEIYDGKQWVSDTKQSGFAPGTTYPGGVTVYRFPD